MNIWGGGNQRNILCLLLCMVLFLKLYFEFGWTWHWNINDPIKWSKKKNDTSKQVLEVFVFLNQNHRWLICSTFSFNQGEKLHTYLFSYFSRIFRKIIEFHLFELISLLIHWCFEECLLWNGSEPCIYTIAQTCKCSVILKAIWNGRPPMDQVTFLTKWNWLCVFF